MKILNLSGSWSLVIGSVMLAVFICVPDSSLAATPRTLLDELPVPRGASLQIISYNAVHNGVPQAVGELKSPHSIDEVSGFYRQLWAHDSEHQLPGYIETELPKWRLISRLHDGYSIVVQLDTQHTSQGTRGFISIRTLDVPSKVPAHGLFSNLDLLSSNRSVDGADTSSLRVYASAQSVTQTHTFYKHRLVKNGWALLSDTFQKNAHAMVLARQQSRLELTFMASQEYASVLVVHRLTSE